MVKEHNEDYACSPKHDNEGSDSGSNSASADDWKKVSDNSMEWDAAAIRKQNNEDSCPIFKLSNDELQLIFQYVGEMQYGFVACTSYRFHHVYLDTFENDTSTSYVNAVASVSCAAVCLHSEEPVIHFHGPSLFMTAVIRGKLEILIWGEVSGYKLRTLLDSDTIITIAASNGNLEVVKYLRQLGFPWDAWTCVFAAMNGHLEILKWARDDGCPWNERTCAYAYRSFELGQGKSLSMG